MSEDSSKANPETTAKAPEAGPSQPDAPKPAVEPTQQAAQEAPPKAQEPKKPAEPIKKEKPSTCVGCSKSIKKKRWYYRDGKYYCSKRCWSQKAKKKETKDAGAAPAASTGS